MKRLIIALSLIEISLGLLSQVPQKITYQAVIRDAANHLVTNQIGIKISILQGTVDGTPVYNEIQTPTPNANGLITIEIGAGDPATFAAINWSTGLFFIKTEIATSDPLTTYTITGTSQLLSVPYAIHAKTASSYNETDPKVAATTLNNISKWNGTALVSSTIFDNGKVGIGTNTPSEILHLKTLTPDGNIRLQVSDDDGYYIGYNNGGNYMALSVTSAGTFYPDILNLKSGKVGIGTNNPSTKLDVNGIITSSGANFTGTITVPKPVNANDAATKDYVDGLKQQIKILEDNLISAGTYKLADIEGNQYNVVKIGTQVWMKENLKTTKYNDGTSIPLVTSDSEWSNLTSAGFCWYYNDATTYKAIYGALYNWHAVNNGKLCPMNWHVPSDAEWTTLENYLIANSFNYDGTTTGNKFAKALASVSGWTSSSIEGAIGNTDYPSKRNATDFTAIPGGCRYMNGVFQVAGNFAYFWSATETDATYAWNRHLTYDNSGITRYSNYKKPGLSVRCIRD